MPAWHLVLAVAPIGTKSTKERGLCQKQLRAVFGESAEAAPQGRILARIVNLNRFEIAVGECIWRNRVGLPESKGADWFVKST